MKADKGRIPSLVGEAALDLAKPEEAEQQVEIDPKQVEMFFGVIKLIGQPARIVAHDQMVSLMASLCDSTGEVVLPWGFSDKDPHALEFARMCMLGLAKQMELLDVFSAFGDAEQEIAQMKAELLDMKGELTRIQGEQNTLLSGIMGELATIRMQMTPSEPGEGADGSDNESAGRPTS